MNVQLALGNQAPLIDHTEAATLESQPASSYVGPTFTPLGAKFPVMEDRWSAFSTTGSLGLLEESSDGHSLSNSTHSQSQQIPSADTALGIRHSALNMGSQDGSEESKRYPKTLTQHPREHSVEGAASTQKAAKIPQGFRDAQWTKIDRKLISPEVLEEANERFETRDDYVIVLRVLTRDQIEHYAMRTKMKEIKRTKHEKRSSISAESRLWSSKGRLESVEDEAYSRRLPSLSSVTRGQEDAPRYPQTADTSSPREHRRKHSVNGISADRLQLVADQNASDETKEEKSHLDAQLIDQSIDVDDPKVRYGELDQVGGRKISPKLRERRGNLRERTEKPTLAKKVQRFFGELASPVPKLSTAGGESQLTIKAPDKPNIIAKVEEDNIYERRIEKESMLIAAGQSLSFPRGSRSKPKVATDGPVARESRKPSIAGEVKDPNDEKRMKKPRSTTEEDAAIKVPRRVIGNKNAAWQGGLPQRPLSDTNTVPEPKPSFTLSTAKDKEARKLALGDSLTDTCMLETSVVVVSGS